MMGTTTTLFRYISRQFMLAFLFTMLILMGIIFLFDVIEMLRRAAGARSAIPTGAVLSMSLMKMPSLAQTIMPMGILFTAIYTCWKLNKTSELVAIRSFGLSAWQFLSPLVLCALLIGVVSTAALNPVSAFFLNRYNKAQATYFQSTKDLLTVSKTGIWLRQPLAASDLPGAETAAEEEGYALIHSATFDKTEWRLNNVIVLFFGEDDTFLRRLDSPVAYLRDGYWEIQTPLVNDRKGPRTAESEQIPTRLTSREIEESFADPDTISFWSIPEYIRIMEDTGFPATRLYIHLQVLLAQPFLLASMILLAATFSLRPIRFGGVSAMIALGVAAGFAVFFIQSVLQAFGMSQKIPAGLAAWTPPVVSLLLGVTALLHTEDG